MPHVYHASYAQNLKTIETRKSTHGMPWVYAMSKPEHALIFLGSGGDFVNQVVFFNGQPRIIERFQNSLEYGAKNKKGSVYTLDGTDFKSGMTSFKPELVCEHNCEALEEIKIDDVLKRLLDLEKEGLITIYRYPNAPEGFPKDKSDLIERAVMWSKQFPVADILRDVEKYHPDILEEVKRRISLK
jgi:hypothetical protein